MFLEVRIVKELRGYFAEVRILKSLRVKPGFVAEDERRRKVRSAFELLFEATRRSMTEW